MNLPENQAAYDRMKKVVDDPKTDTLSRTRLKYNIKLVPFFDKKNINVDTVLDGARFHDDGHGVVTHITYRLLLDEPELGEPYHEGGGPRYLSSQRTLVL